MKYRYYVKFDRFYSYTTPFLNETVWVLLETNIELSDDTIEDWEKEAYNALWKQYPIWVCKFNQSNPPKKEFDKLRYGWSSVFIREHIRL